ncbi:uncharacterized protein LOC106468128 isoform X2 [Limulus polyphemus]|uniref:Uncharacterized protein LOC106468128 isoform X2 n=1 Tax=Limulus polyphemus TaxID=6850 RepID=A0ABM1T8D8_LIMPO|nr:uncharacterized protein LOC106468128 isoform X2 [Limulus polyphemus]
MSNWKQSSTANGSYTLSRENNHSTHKDIKRKRSLELTFDTTSGFATEIGKISSQDGSIKWSHIKNKFELGHASSKSTNFGVFKEVDNLSMSQPRRESSENSLRASENLEKSSQNGNKKFESSNITLNKNFYNKETSKKLSKTDNCNFLQLFDKQLYKDTASYSNHVYHPTEIRGPGSNSISRSDNKKDSNKTAQASCKPFSNSSTTNHCKLYSSRKVYDNLKANKTAQILYPNVRNSLVCNDRTDITSNNRILETGFSSLTESTAGHAKTEVIKNSINYYKKDYWDNCRISKFSTMPVSRTFNISEKSKVSQLKEKFDHQSEKFHNDKKTGTELSNNTVLKRDKTACGNHKNSTRPNSSPLFERTSKHSEISTNKHVFRCSGDPCALETDKQLATSIPKPQTSLVKQFIKIFEQYLDISPESLERSKQECSDVHSTSVKFTEEYAFQNFTWSSKPENRNLRNFQNSNASVCDNSKNERINTQPPSTRKEMNFEKCQERPSRPKSLTESNSYVKSQVANFEQLTKNQLTVQNKDGNLSIYSTLKLDEDEKFIQYRYSTGKLNEYLHNLGLNITGKPSNEINTFNGQENGPENKSEDRANEISKNQDKKEIVEIKPKNRQVKSFIHRWPLLDSNHPYINTKKQLKSDLNCTEAVNIEMIPEEQSIEDLSDSYFKNEEESLKSLEISLDCLSGSPGCEGPYNEFFECNSLVSTEDGFSDVSDSESCDYSSNKDTWLRRKEKASVNSKRPYSNMRLEVKVENHVYQNTSMMDIVPVDDDEAFKKTAESEHIYESVCFKDSSNHDQPDSFDSGICLEESKLPASIRTGQVPESQHYRVENQILKTSDTQLVMPSCTEINPEASSLGNVVNSSTQKSSRKHSLTKMLFQRAKGRLFSWKENSLTRKEGSSFYIPYTLEYTQASPQQRSLPPLPCVSTPPDVTSALCSSPKSKACEQMDSVSEKIIVLQANAIKTGQSQIQKPYSRAENSTVKSCMESESLLESVMSSIEWNPYLRFSIDNSKLSDSRQSGILMNNTCDSSASFAATDPKSLEDGVMDDNGFKNIYSNLCSLTPNTKMSDLNSCGSPPQPKICLKQMSLEGKRTLWEDIPEVRNSGLLETMTSQQIQQQEALFEIITSEASYLRSLDILVEHFINCPELTNQSSADCILEQMEIETLFSDILPIRIVSQRLLAELEARLSKSLLVPNICDILHNYALNHFSIYIKYCSNKICQEMMLYSLRQNKPEFEMLLQTLESNPVCQNLNMNSFLILPMQRITRFPLLVKAVCDRLPTDSPGFKVSKLALKAMNKVVKDCNEGAKVMEKTMEMLCLSHQLEFKNCNSFTLISASRWLVKKGEVIRLLPDETTKYTFGRTTRCTRVPIYLFLFTDLLLLTKKNSEKNYTVIDYCPRKFVQTVLLDRSLKPNVPAHVEDCKKAFLLIMLNNHKGKTKEMILSCSSKSERACWVKTLNSAASENSSENIYEYLGKH